ncbi:MAG: HAD family hydrolase [Bacteroidia bacterium]|nr:HAD family hydrolase [Bacteroidia bacterium]
MPSFDKRWTLFLDRDGVINIEKTGGYILSWEEFRFEEGAVEALVRLSSLFGRIVVVTNQRGVGRGLMSKEDLEDIHLRMRAVIQQAGGRVDAVYACTDVTDDSFCRKPQVGMAYWARRDFPDIDFARSVMVGNSESDMRFGRALGMYTVWIASVHPFPSPGLADEVWPSLKAWAFSFEGGESQP